MDLPHCQHTTPAVPPLGRRSDDVVYEVERRPPYRVVAVHARDGTNPITPALIGLPADFILSVLEPEQPTLVNVVSRALRDVRVGAPHIVRYHSARYRSQARIAEIADRGPDHKHLYVFCRDERVTLYTDFLRDEHR